MRNVSLFRWSIAVMLTVSMVGVAHAQNDPPSTKAEAQSAKVAPSANTTEPMDEPVASPGRVTEVKPDVFYLRDKDGVLKQVPGFTFEDFVELYALKKELARASEPARFGIDQVKLTGAASGDTAELTAEVTVTTHDDGWVRVALGFAPAMLTKPPTYDGPSEQIIQFDAKSEGYVAWLQGIRGKQHRLKMPLLTTLAAMGDQTRLKLGLPRTTLASRIEFVVPHPRIVVHASEGTIARTRPTGDGKGTAIHVTGPPAQFDIGWQVAGEAGAGPTRRLIADKTRIGVMVDGQGTRFDATLVVRAVDGPFDAFDVRLPAGATLVSTSQSGYTLQSRTESNVTIVQVRLARQTDDPFAVRLAAQRPRVSLMAPESLDLSGFVVVGAALQTGQMVVSVEGDWRIEWNQERDVREIDPPADLPEVERDRVVAAYEFFRQPFSLVATVSPQKPDVTVDPHYALTVESEQVLLDATLQYMIRGAKVSQLRVALPGWEVVDAGPGNLVDPDADLKDNGGALTIPLTQRQRGKVRLTLQARRTVGEGATDINLELPRPHADVVRPATLTVQAADHVELSPRLAQMPGLVPQPTVSSSQASWGLWQQSPESFRQTTTDALRYVAGRKIRPREIGVEALSEVRLDTSGATVEQTLNYQVAYESLEQVLLHVPVDLVGNHDLKFTVGTSPITPVPVAEFPKTSAPGASSSSRVALRLAKPQVGPLQVKVRFRLPWATGTTARRRVVPLVMPAEGAIRKNEARVSTLTGSQFGVDDPAWEARGGNRPTCKRRGVVFGQRPSFGAPPHLGIAAVANHGRFRLDSDLVLGQPATGSRGVSGQQPRDGSPHRDAGRRFVGRYRALD